MIPPARPMRKPVNIVTRIAVEPTDPKANGPAKRPTTAISDILKRTWRTLESISGMLKTKMFFQRDP